MSSLINDNQNGYIPLKLKIYCGNDCKSLFKPPKFWNLQEPQ